MPQQPPPTGPVTGPPPDRPRRRDAQLRRDRLLTAVGTLLTGGTRDFTLTELARLAGVSVATTYRNFPDTATAITAYSDRLTSGLLVAFSAVPTDTDPRVELRAICDTGVEHAAGWGPAVVHLRSPQGILARRLAGEPFIVALCERLTAILRRCVAAGALPDQDLDFAVLAWITLLDERVVVDLTRTLRWPVVKVADQLARTLLAVLTAGTPVTTV
jgi:AcrR family transcriptional regulator